MQSKAVASGREANRRRALRSVLHKKQDRVARVDRVAVLGDLVAGPSGSGHLPAAAGSGCGPRAPSREPGGLFVEHPFGAADHGLDRDIRDEQDPHDRNPPRLRPQKRSNP